MAGESTYAPGSTADRDRCRLYLGDTDVTGTALFDDAEWDDFLATEVSVNKAVAKAAETMMARSATKMDFSADGSSFKASQTYNHWKTMARQFRTKGQGASVVVATPVDGYSQDTPSDDVLETREDN